MGNTTNTDEFAILVEEALATFSKNGTLYDEVYIPRTSSSIDLQPEGIINLQQLPPGTCISYRSFVGALIKDNMDYEMIVGDNGEIQIWALPNIANRNYDGVTCPVRSIGSWSRNNENQITLEEGIIRARANAFVPKLEYVGLKVQDPQEILQGGTFRFVYISEPTDNQNQIFIFTIL